MTDATEPYFGDYPDGRCDTSLTILLAGALLCNIPFIIGCNLQAV